MRKHLVPTIGTYALLCLAGGTSLLMPETLTIPDSYAEGRERANFVIAGASRFGDATLEAVEYPSGKRFDAFIMAADVDDFFFSGAPGEMRAVSSRDVVGKGAGVFALESGDGDPATVTATDMDRFTDRLLAMHRDRNLNCHLEIEGDGEFSYVIEFERTVADDQPDLDSYGEIICFERGGGGSDSWFLLEPVDANGRVIGTPLAVGPDDMHSTAPPARLGLYDDTGLPTHRTEEMSGTTVDLTQLGVASLRHLRVSTPVAGRHGYPGGDTSADLKIIAVATTATD